MSSELKAILNKVAQEDYKSEEAMIEKRLDHYKSLILKIAEARKWDLPVWVEGSILKDMEKYEKDLNILERGNIVKGRMKYTERNAYREYQLTKKGVELAKKLTR